MRRGILAAIAIGAIAIPCAFGYNGETISASGQTTQVTRPDSANLQFYLNTGVVAGAASSLLGSTVITSDSNPTAAVEAAMATWNNVGAANIHFDALQTTGAGHSSTDCQNVITIAASTADLSVLGFVSPSSPGAVAVTANYLVEGAGSFCGLTVAAGSIVDSDILLNPYMQFSTTRVSGTKDLQSVLTHEFGHVFGMNHSSLLGATMYPYSEVYERHVSWDEKTFVAQYYPSGKQSLGTISGTATVGGSPIKYGMLTATDVSGGGKVVCGLTALDGTYSIQVPPGLYNIYVEPFNSLVGALNIYSLTSGTGTLDPTQATTAFQPGFAGGNSATGATQYTVTAGSSSTANITAIAGVSTLAAPTYGIVAKGAALNSTSLSAFGGAIPVTANQQYDLILIGTAIDATVAVYYVGTNVTLVGSPVKDSSVTYNGLPVIRQTISIGNQTNTTLGSIFISDAKAANFVSLSGLLDIEPATPVISSVQDAESARTSVTSGQWASVYGSSLVNTGSCVTGVSCRTWNANTDFTGGVTAGSPLPTSLDGVSVTVNGTPAGVYFICSASSGLCSTDQVNFVTPSGLTPGSATVVVSNQGTSSAAFTTTVAQASPSFFYLAASASTIYPLGVHLSDGKLIGDPTVLSYAERAHPGETVAMYCNGLAAATGGIIVPVAAFTQQVTVTAGSTPLGVSAPYLVAAGEFQINVTIPSTLAAGNYQLTMTVPGGTTTGDGVTITLPVGP